MSRWSEEAADEAKGGRDNLPAVITPGSAAAVPATLTLDLAPEAWQLAQKIAGTEFVPSALRGKPEAVLACMLAGNELGLPLMTSLSKIHVVDGRPGLASETMRALVLAAGHELWVEEKSTTAVTVGGQRAGSSRAQRVTWTIEDARSAGLAGKGNWNKYPRAMLTARAMAELCRDLFPDVIGGLYSVEELQDGFGFDDLPPEPPEDRPARTAISSPKARKRATSRAKAAAGAGAEPEPPPLPDDDEVIEATIVEDDETPPPLPDDDPGSPSGPSGEVEEQEPAGVTRAKRSQQIAMRARELDLDRAQVISAVTGGTKTSARELDDAEADLVLEALRRLKVGEIRLVEDDDEARLVDAPPAANGADDGEVVQGELVGDEWDLGDGPAWREVIKGAGKTWSAALREATRLSQEFEVVPPTDAPTLAAADPRVRAGLIAWMDQA